MGQLTFKRVTFTQAPPLEQFEDRTIFQTEAWMQFVARTQNATPVVAMIMDKGRCVGRFSGLIIKKFGLRILGSPFPGWTTSYMGFNLEPGVSRLEALLALEVFAFQELKCIHLEIMDYHLSLEEIQTAQFLFRILSGFEIDLSQTQTALFNAMKPACRRCIRKAEKNGVNLEIATDLSFVDDYYAQLEDVFAKQNLVPTYSKARVKDLLAYLLPTGQLLLLKAKDRQGNCIATGVFPAFNKTMYFWGGASWRDYQSLRPNEAMQWFAMLYWKERGMVRYDMGGSGEYKRKYGGVEIAIPWGRKSKYHIFETLRNKGKELFAFNQRRGYFKKGRT